MCFIFCVLYVENWDEYVEEQIELLDFLSD